MKIAILNKYQKQVMRGAETFVSELSKRLSRNHGVDVISDINYWNLLKNKYDIIIPTNGRWQAVIVRKIAWLTGAKVIISGQSGAGFDDRINLYAFPDVFVALTEYQKKWAEKINPFVKVVKIPNGANLEMFKPTSHTGKIVIADGAYTSEKRHDLTIKAVSRIEGLKLIIIGGGGENRKEIENLGIKMLGPNRFETKTVEYKDVPVEFSKAVVSVFPSVPWESFGIAIVEAMASGLPVVATNDPIRKEIIGDAGILVDPTNIEEYAKALEKALDTNWGNKPRIQAQKFSWDIIAEKYEKLFKNLNS